MTGPIHAALVGLTNATLQLVVSFGVNVSTNQDAAITVMVNSFLVLLALVWRANGFHKTPPGP